jgi:hypothetical protein
MIKEFVERFEKNKEKLRELFSQKHPDQYSDIVKAVVEVLSDEDEYWSIDPKRIHEINDGDYQGTLLFVIADTSYQPNNYWYVKVIYGSCSGCDTLESIKKYSDEKPTQDQVNDYMTLALHIVQGLKKTEIGEVNE